jgi:hypothetical protein
LSEVVERPGQVAGVVVVAGGGCETLEPQADSETERPTNKTARTETENTNGILFNAELLAELLNCFSNRLVMQVQTSQV